MSPSKALEDRKCRRIPPDCVLRQATGYAFPRSLSGRPAQLYVLTEELLQNEWRERAEIQARQFAQLRSLLQFAVTHCPFYAERITSSGVNPGALESLEEFRRIPILTRRHLQDHLPRIRAKRLPPGTEASGELATSGSTGAPVKLRASNMSSLLWAACSLRDHIWAGVDLKGTAVCIRHFSDANKQAHTAEGRRLTDWGGEVAATFETGETYLQDIGQDLEDQLALLVKVNPDALLSYPSNLNVLGQMVVERGIKFDRLKSITAISEILPDYLRKSIEAAFGARVWDLYSTVETGYIASQCPSGHGYHVHEENVLVELLDERGEPAEPGEPGRVVLTSLMNYIVPVIRYDIGDYATQIEEPCPCGRNLMRLKEVVGRRRDQLLLPDGRFKFATRLGGIISRAASVREFRVIQHERDHLEVLVVPREAFGDQQKKRITEKFREYIGFPVKITFDTVKKLERTAGGKHMEFVCNAE